MFLNFGKRFTLLSIFSLLAVCSLTAVAQDKIWREVSPAELQMKTPQVEPDADAEAVFWEVRVDDSSDSDLSLSHYVRVKIFTERGREKYSKFDVPFTRGIKIKDLAARVIKPDGSIVEITKQDIFEREIIKANKVKIKAKSFAVPGIEPGVIVEYRYREAVGDAGAKGMTLVFQREIPVQKLSYYYKPYNKKEPNYQSFNFTDTKFIKDDKGFYLAQRTNVPAFKEEPRMPPGDTVRPWMLLQGSSFGLVNASAFSISYTIKDPKIPTLYWGAVSTEYSGLVKQMNKPDKEIKRTAAELTASASTPEEKLRKLYEFCQTQIRNTNFDTSLTDEQRAKLPKNKTLADVLKNKSAGSQFIDMLFGAMASSLGMETRIALAGDRSKMFFNPGMTNDSFIHPAAIAVKVGENWKFFNPGVKFLPAGMLVWYEEDVWAMLVGEKNYSWEQTPLSGIDKTVAKRTGKFKLLEDGTLEGTVKVEYTGQNALDFKMDNYDESANTREENLKNEIKARMTTAEISDFSVSDIVDAEKPVIYQYKVRVPNYAQKTGKRLFLQPGFFEYGGSPIFSSATRKYDVFFRYPWSEEDEVQIELPKGFALDNADAPGMLEDPQKIGSLKINIGMNKEGNIMSYRRKFHFGGGEKILFPVGSYQPLRNLFDGFHKADTHTITLKQN
ncbi:MAG: DUF3857 and transglutaminase domain-containing protein [Pyrinomonadaceae bacterium]|nr:DUF3857 and transglutaminase domain-containing protein [Pyrinomonadaceae bacterium]